VTTTRRLLAALFAVTMVFGAALPALGYNGENQLHIRLSQPQHVGCGEATPLIATVTDKAGEPQAGVVVSFSKHQGDPGDTLAPTSNVTDANGEAASTYTIACGSEPGARVIKACEPAGACATTVVTCQESDGCTGSEAAGGLSVIQEPSRESAATAQETGAGTPTTVPTFPLLLNVLGILLLR
jgi:hypothetical protein